MRLSGTDGLNKIFVLGDRDVASCDALAGAPPCYYLDFSGIYTARQFHIRMEELYHYWLKKHCNPEWRVHFEALLKRMRNSLFCDDGSAPDHVGYNISPAPPVYKPSEAPYTYQVTIVYFTKMNQKYWVGLGNPKIRKLLNKVTLKSKNNKP